jgi:peptidoglycan/LPS O-acetylase OafA/YrhL
MVYTDASMPGSAAQAAARIVDAAERPSAPAEAAAALPAPVLPPPEPVAQKKPKGLHIPSLDGLRAISFLIVFVAHSGLEWIVPGGFGVTVFFYLSGFLITTLMRVEYRRDGTVSLRAFYVRRVLRILPPFYLVLVLAHALTLVHVLPGQLEAGPVLGGEVFHLLYRRWHSTHSW